MMDEGFEKVNDRLQYDSSEREILGSGRYGIVFPGHLIEDGARKKVAVKRFQRHALNKSSIKLEVGVMLKAKDHPNILRYLYSTASTDKMLLCINYFLYYIKCLLIYKILNFITLDSSPYSFL